MLGFSTSQQNVTSQRLTFSQTHINGIDPFIGMRNQDPPSGNKLTRAVNWCSENSDYLLDRALFTAIVLAIATPVMAGIIAGVIHKNAGIGFLTAIVFFVAEYGVAQALPIIGGLAGLILYGGSVAANGAVRLAAYAIRPAQDQTNRMTNEDKLRVCANILAGKFNDSEDKKIQRLQIALAQVTELNLAFGNHSRFAILSEKNKELFISVTDADILVLTKALANLMGKPELAAHHHASHPVASLTNLLSELNMDMVCVTASPNSIANFTASSKTPTGMKLNKCCLCDCRKDSEIGKHFLDLASKANTLASLSIKENSFSETHLPLVRQIFKNDSTLTKLTELSLKENQISKETMEVLAAFIRRSTALQKLHMRANHERHINKIVNGRRYTEFTSQNINELMLAISKNTSLSVVRIIDGGLRRWMNTPDAIQFFDELKTNPSLTFLKLAVSVNRCNEMVVHPSIQKAMYEMLRCNAALIQIAVEGLPCLQTKEINKTANAWLAGNKVVRQLENQPTLILKELILCARTLPAEVVKKIEQYILWQGNAADIERVRHFVKE